jgi:hypothetical protein
MEKRCVKEDRDLANHCNCSATISGQIPFKMMTGVNMLHIPIAGLHPR